MHYEAVCLRSANRSFDRSFLPVKTDYNFALSLTRPHFRDSTSKRVAHAAKIRPIAFVNVHMGNVIVSALDRISSGKSRLILDNL